MNYEFVITCARCGKDFKLLWVMDQMRVGPKSVARITCPACEERFYQMVSDLVPLKARGPDLLTSRPVRTVELVYDCPSCLMRGISTTLMHTDLSWDDLATETVHTTVCYNARCPHRGLQQKLKPGRTRLGSLNPSL